MKFDKPVHITIDSPHVSYEFDVRSKCIILRGDSATGKTTLIRLLDSGVAMTNSGGLDLMRLPMPNIFGWDNWVEEIMSIPENILLYTDEDDLKELSLEMQGVLERSSAAYLLVTREMLTEIPEDQKDFKRMESVRDSNKVINRLISVDFRIGDSNDEVSTRFFA